MARTKASESSNSAAGLQAQSPLPPGVTRGLAERPNHNWGIDLSTPMDRCPTNIDVTDPRQRALIIAATQVPDYQLDQTGKCIVRATHYFAYATEYVNEQTGELELARVCVLFDREGRIFKTTGVFAFNGLRAAAALYTPAEWAAGIPFVIQARLTSNRRIAHDVRVLIDAEDASGPPSEPTE